jgi:hypothetical protein
MVVLFYAVTNSVVVSTGLYFSLVVLWSSPLIVTIEIVWSSISWWL